MRLKPGKLVLNIAPKITITCFLDYHYVIQTLPCDDHYVIFFDIIVDIIIDSR